MRFFCYLGAVSCCLLYFFDENHITLGLVCMLLPLLDFTAAWYFTIHTCRK